MKSRFDCPAVKLAKEFIARKRKRECDRRYYHKNAKKMNAGRIKRKHENREVTNEIARKFYHRNRESYLGKIYAARRKRDPTIGLFTAILSYKRGSGDYGEILRRIEGADQRINEKLANVFGPTGQAINCEMYERDSRVNESEA